MNRYPSKSIQMPRSCWACGYLRGNLIYRSESDSGLIKCGNCDAFQGASEAVGGER